MANHVQLAARAALGAQAEQALLQLMQSPALRSHTIARQCEIGPYVLDFVIATHALAVEVQEVRPRDRERQESRAAFLGGLGFRVLCVPPELLLKRPQAALDLVLATLHSANCGAGSGV